MTYGKPENVIWKVADRDKVAGMLEQGWSAAKIGQAMEISRARPLAGFSEMTN